MKWNSKARGPARPTSATWMSSRRNRQKESKPSKSSKESKESTPSRLMHVSQLSSKKLIKKLQKGNSRGERRSTKLTSNYKRTQRWTSTQILKLTRSSESSSRYQRARQPLKTWITRCLRARMEGWKHVQMSSTPSSTSNSTLWTLRLPGVARTVLTHRQSHSSKWGTACRLAAVESRIVAITPTTCKKSHNRGWVSASRRLPIRKTWRTPSCISYLAMSRLWIGMIRWRLR